MGYMILLTFSLLLAQLTVVLDETLEIRESIFQSNRHDNLVELSRLVILYRIWSNRYPADLATLAGTDGFAMSRSFSEQLPNVIYQVANINQGGIEYQRVLLATQGKYDVVSTNSFLNANECGATNFNESAAFCPDTESLYFLSESRSGYDDELTQTIMFLDMTIAKLINTVENGDFFDNSDSLNDGDSATLATLVGYGGTAENCSGLFVLNNQPFGCQDLFSPYSGALVTYNFINSKHIALVVDLSSRDSTGAVRFVSRDIRI